MSMRRRAMRGMRGLIPNVQDTMPCSIHWFEDSMGIKTRLAVPPRAKAPRICTEPRSIKTNDRKGLR